jgi:hypothetical protein
MVRKCNALVLKLFGFILYDVVRRTLGLVFCSMSISSCTILITLVTEGGIRPSLYDDFPRAFLINGYHSRGIKTKVE